MNKIYVIILSTLSIPLNAVNYFPDFPQIEHVRLSMLTLLKSCHASCENKKHLKKYKNTKECCQQACDELDNYSGQYLVAAHNIMINKYPDLCRKQKKRPNALTW
jgi:hypothetical protein